MILDLFRVTGRVAVVTGAGRGLGAAAAVALAEAGADVVQYAHLVEHGFFKGQLDRASAVLRNPGKC